MPSIRNRTKKTHKTSNVVKGSSNISLSEEIPNRRRFIPPIIDHLKSKDFWVAWFRQPDVEIAEAVIRLRRLRELTQAALAERMQTKQSAIARIEAGRSNLRISTVVQLAEALNAVIRIDMSPVELIENRMNVSRWWAFRLSSEHDTTEIERTYQLSVTMALRSTMVMLGSSENVQLGIVDGSEDQSNFVPLPSMAKSSRSLVE